MNILPTFKCSFALCHGTHYREMWASIDQTGVSIMHTANRYTGLSFKSIVALSKYHTQPNHLTLDQPGNSDKCLVLEPAQPPLAWGKEKGYLHSVRCYAELTRPQDGPKGRPVSRKPQQKLYSISCNTSEVNKNRHTDRIKHVTLQGSYHLWRRDILQSTTYRYGGTQLL